MLELNHIKLFYKNKIQNRMKFQLIYCFWFLFFAPISDALICLPLPERCRFEDVFVTPNYENLEKGFWKHFSLLCEFDLNNNAFKFNMTLVKCDEENNEKMGRILDIIFRWTSSNDLAILDKRFQYSNVELFFIHWRILPRDFRFWNFDGFDLNILDELLKHYFVRTIEIAKSRLDFYHNKRKIESCEDITNLNLTLIRSIFQITRITGILILRDIQYKHSICPLVFQNFESYKLLLIDLVDSFYKRSILNFHNETYPNLNYYVTHLEIYKARDINLDLSLLHPSVFNFTEKIKIDSGSLNSISGEIFKHLKMLLKIEISRIIFRKINHKQGIEWIRQWNYGINENLSNITNGTRALEIDLKSKQHPLYRSFMEAPISRSLPDEDFCLYVNFPFNQLVIVYESDLEDYINDVYFSCTFSWLVQYSEYYYKYFIDINRDSYDLKFSLNTTSFKSISKCDFEKRLSDCNKSNYQRKDIWDENDFFILNKKIQIAFKISLYPISLLGLTTNFIVVLIILKNKNSDLFKEFKQYNYLYLNSVFCMIITVIELLSWMTECFYPFEVFCPEIRKLVAIQFFKIIFQECLITTLRFMCNFTYIAFSLNRISLIGKDHGKLVTFMSQVDIKKYIGVTFFISCSLSWIKGFRYEVNYFYPTANFPMSNEMDIIQASIVSSRFVDFYFVFNSIIDMVNYFVFVVICVVIDICMVVQLRRTLEEKSIKSALMNQNLNNESKKAENEEAVNKAIKMVILNSSIGIFFKLPVFFIPLLNIWAQFHFKDFNYFKIHTSFGRFYLILLDSGFYFLIQDMSNFFFTFSLSIQMFIYKRFDKKFNLGYERLKDQVFNYLRKRFRFNNESAQEKNTVR